MPKIGNKCDFWFSFAQRPSLADRAEISRGCGGILWLCMVQVLARLVEVWPSYRQKTAQNWPKNAIFDQFRGEKKTVVKYCEQKIKGTDRD